MFGFDFPLRCFLKTLDVLRNFINKAIIYYMFLYLPIFSVICKLVELDDLNYKIAFCKLIHYLE